MRGLVWAEDQVLLAEAAPSTLARVRTDSRKELPVEAEQQFGVRSTVVQSAAVDLLRYPMELASESLILLRRIAASRI